MKQARVNQTLKIGIISDGQYGERAHEAIKEVFDTKWILVPVIPSTTMIDDDLDLDIPACDLYLSYVRHPDIILMLAELDKPLILGVMPGTGLLKQAQTINPRVVGARTMCSLEPSTGISEVDEFATRFGRPVYDVTVDGSGTVQEALVKRKSPCGSSVAGARFIQGKTLDEHHLQEFALSICHECRAPRFGHTCDKEVSGIIHVLALVNGAPSGALQAMDPGTRDFVAKLEIEYEKRS